jgi:phospholipid/cholesterol/gamma-HCH transport system substrate-binding protein
MKARHINNLKLGVFVLTGMLVLILALYMIGRDTNAFGRNFELRARFENVQGLTIGNNVRYAGIQVGTVKKIKILNDTLIEITMLIADKMKPFIHKNDMVNISTDGLMGNKLINISPAKDNSPVVEEKDILATKHIINTDQMLATLAGTNDNLALISENIKLTVQRVNNSSALWRILDDQSIAENLARSMVNVRDATAGADEFVTDLHTIISNVKEGKGTLGTILTDTAIAHGLNKAILTIRQVGDNANQLASELKGLTQTINQDVTTGKGTVNMLFKDSSLARKLNNTLSNIEQGTDGFNQNMEALKHNFLMRGYFRRQEKQRKKGQENTASLLP